MTDKDFGALRERLKHRLIRSVDISSILILDAVILLLGYGLIKFVHLVAVDGTELFQMTEVVSEGAFLLVYVAWVAWDLLEFAKRV